jgi:hypothetical protein
MSVTICLSVAEDQTRVRVVDRQDDSDVWDGVFDACDTPTKAIRSSFDAGKEFGTIAVLGADGLIGDDEVVFEGDQVAFSQNGGAFKIVRGGCTAAPAVRKATKA